MYAAGNANKVAASTLSATTSPSSSSELQFGLKKNPQMVSFKFESKRSSQMGLDEKDPYAPATSNHAEGEKIKETAKNESQEHFSTIRPQELPNTYIPLLSQLGTLCFSNNT